MRPALLRHLRTARGPRLGFPFGRFRQVTSAGTSSATELSKAPAILSRVLLPQPLPERSDEEQQLFRRAVTGDSAKHVAHRRIRHEALVIQPGEDIFELHAPVNWQGHLILGLLAGSADSLSCYHGSALRQHPGQWPGCCLGLQTRLQPF